MKGQKQLVSLELIERKIYFIRGQKVMLDCDLAELYCVETKQLNRAVKRNVDRFPGDFMFQLTEDEAASLRCQTGTSKTERGGRWIGGRCESAGKSRQRVGSVSLPQGNG